MIEMWPAVAIGLGLYLAIDCGQKIFDKIRVWRIGRQIVQNAKEAREAESKAFRVQGIATVLECEYPEYVHTYMESELYETINSGGEFYVRHKGPGPWTKIVKVPEHQGWE